MGKCRHLSRIVKYVETDEGSLQLEICDDPRCAKIFVMCEHKKNTWNEQGDMLTCDLCGVDGT